MVNLGEVVEEPKNLGVERKVVVEVVGVLAALVDDCIDYTDQTGNTWELVEAAYSQTLVA